MSSTPHTAKDIITANIAALIEQLEQGNSKALTEYLAAMGRFHRYSFGNVLEIARQRPAASRVAGFHSWNQLGRRVKKGEKGIRIFAPIIRSHRKNETSPNAQPTEEKTRAIAGFRAVYVFDIEQTEGEPLPELTSATTGDVGEHRTRLDAFIVAQGITVEASDSIAPALGVSYGGRIALLPGQPAAEEFSTLVHELAHEMLHKADRRANTTKTTRETEAEAVAFVVCRTVGLHTGTASADYIRLYNGDAALLTECLEAVQRTSAAILAALEPPAQSEDRPPLAMAS